MTIATTESHGLALATEQDWWTDKQLAALRQIGVDRASNGDLAVFMHVCQRTGLDPFARQIYMILRDGKQVIQTGIDGMRLVARRAVDRNQEAFSIAAPEWCGPDGQWTDVWLSSEPPAAARVTVTRGAGTFSAVALWKEYVQTKRDGGITRMWATRGAGQLAKCAEALALRKACPQDLSGIYAEDEMGRDRREQARSGGLGAVLVEQSPETAASETPESDHERPATDRTVAAVTALMDECGIGLPEDQEAFMTDTVGHDQPFTEAEAVEAGKRLRRIQQGDPEAEWQPVLDGEAVES